MDADAGNNVLYNLHGGQKASRKSEFKNLKLIQMKTISQVVLKYQLNTEPVFKSQKWSFKVPSSLL